jgi:hypothetical protein
MAFFNSLTTLELRELTSSKPEGSCCDIQGYDSTEITELPWPEKEKSLAFDSTRPSGESSHPTSEPPYNLVSARDTDVGFMTLKPTACSNLRGPGYGFPLREQVKESELQEQLQQQKVALDVMRKPGDSYSEPALGEQESRRQQGRSEEPSSDTCHTKSSGHTHNTNDRVNRARTIATKNDELQSGRSNAY